MIKGKIKELSEQYFDEVVKIRRHIHQNPELSFHEFKTSELIFDQLKQLGLNPEFVANTGVTALIKGKEGGKTIALRADMDALPIQEENKHAYISQHAGVMHACGHDVHTSSLLGAARILSELKSSFKGNIKLIFQPAEEKIPGGAKQMISEGILESPLVNFIFGQHVDPELEVGTVGFRPGDYMASTDEIYITIHGKGGHAAMPWKLVDPVLISSHIIVALQQIVSRNALPNIPTVLSFGKVETINGANNVIPNTVKLHGTFRTFNETWRSQAHEKIKQIATNLAKSMGGEAHVEILNGYPVLKNEEELTKQSIRHAKDFMGDACVKDLDIRMTAEDFAYFSHAQPSVFYRLGTGNKNKGITSSLHTPTFDVDENALKTGMGLMSYLALKCLEH